MGDKPPFDPIQFACWLIAAVLAVQCLVVLFSITACLLHARDVIVDPHIECDPKDRIGQLMSGLLAAALALLAGFRGRDK